MSVAVLFPGQGSQYPGMADPWTAHSAGKEVLQAASDVLECDLTGLCQDEQALATTEWVQPAIFVCDVAAYRVLESEGIEFSAAAGHSLGEFAALVAAGVLELGPALETVVVRGRAMQAASDKSPSTMSAIIGMSSEQAADLCLVAGRGDVLEVANENAPNQIVISGTIDAVSRAEELARSQGAKAVRLKVAGAFHSPLMRPALAEVRDAIAQLVFARPAFPVVPNASGRPTTEPSALRDLLSRQMVSPVRWERTMSSLSGAGAATFVEAGPGDVLSKLARRTVPGASAIAVGDPAGAEALAREVEEG